MPDLRASSVPPAASYTQRPILSQWQADTPAGRVEGRANDPLLRSIDELVDALQTAEDGAELYLLGQLFFATMSWINHCKKNPLMAGTTRNPNRASVLSLNLYAANALCAGLGCRLGQLATRLQELYGVAMTQRGIDIDRDKQPRYFDAAKREAYRTFVLFGRLWHYRSKDRALKFVPLDTTDSYTEGREGYGFVLSMSNELYVGNFGQMFKTYHSTFMAGRPVQCAGTIRIRNGVVTHLKNDSGHYKPVDQALVKVLLYLRMHGVDLSRIVVTCVPKKRGEQAEEAAGTEFLDANGNWEGIRARAEHQSPL